ncbi:MAG: hypothetical protein EP335_00695 [Alphaproteobacteria bacterium]|nr:MAG: hypothetical protein EP335_00695 [Alphaproteobacteria bacterium]
MGLPLLFMALLFAAQLPARADDSEAPASHALSLDFAGRFLVEVQVADNPRRFPFLLDTGAERTMLYRSLVTELDLSALPRQSTRVQTATGIRTMQLYDVGSLQALGRTVRPGPAAVMPDVDLPGTYGILGVEFLHGRTVELAGDRLTVHEGSAMPPRDGWFHIEGRPVGRGSLAVDVQIGTLLVPAMVDTGANVSVLNRAAYRALVEGGWVELEENVDSLIAAGGTVQAARVSGKQVAIGGKTYGRPSLLVADLSIFASLGARHSPAMIIGMDLIGRQPVVIDFSRWQLAIREADTP